jgi:arylsulfatase A-like enzyme
MAKEFTGEINLDVRDSTPDWSAFLPDRAPGGSPNVLVVLYDDTGCAAWSPYGGRINMPTMQRLADNGLTYSQWHTTALCSPTRSTFLTGRNHHLNGFATISESSTGFPGYSSHIPPENATMATVLRDAGWSTYWVGKNHNVPVDEWTMGASKKNWPLGQGYDRFYGFIGGETNQWYPDLAEDNHYIDQPYLPEDGYHLSKDLADQALRFLRDAKQSEPDKPWYLWFCPGANHAPHHAPQEYIDRYKGRFDDGYEAYREWVLPRMIERGILPEGTELTPINPMPEGTFTKGDAVRPWDSLSDEEKRLFSRMAEVYAGFSEYTDAQVGRIVDYLEESGQLENTIIFYCADNGASGEGSPNGSVNEGKVFGGYPDDLQQNLAMVDQLGTPDTYNHYPTGWAVAFSTPYRMFKRYTYQGGVCDPLVIHWPEGINARGQVRHQYHHSTDVVPTILDVCGVEFPEVYNGVTQTPLSGVSMRYSFDADPDGPTQKQTQYYEMFGSRGIWHQGWKAVTVHGPTSGMSNFRPGPLAAVPHRHRPLRSPRPGRPAPREARGAQGALARGGQGEQRAPAERHGHHRQPRGPGDLHGHGVQRARAPQRPVHLLPGHHRGPGTVGGQRARRLLQGARRGRAHPHRRGGDLRPRLTLRRPRADRQGRPAQLHLQLPRGPTGAGNLGVRPGLGKTHPGGRVHQGAGG